MAHRILNMPIVGTNTYNALQTYLFKSTVKYWYLFLSDCKITSQSYLDWVAPWPATYSKGHGNKVLDCRLGEKFHLPQWAFIYGYFTIHTAHYPITDRMYSSCPNVIYPWVNILVSKPWIWRLSEQSRTYALMQIYLYLCFNKTIKQGLFEGAPHKWGTEWGLRTDLKGWYTWKTI